MDRANTWTFIAGGMLALGLMASISAGPVLPSALAAPARIVLGLIVVLFLPGYFLQAAFFPRAAQLDRLERLGLGLGLSLVLVPVIGFVLDKLPTGVRQEPMVNGLLLVTLLAMAAAWARLAAIPAPLRFRLAVPVAAGAGWRGQPRRVYLLWGVVAVALALVGASGAAIATWQRPAERYTEFYVLGEGGQAEGYPRPVVAGQPVQVTVGVVNREDAPALYRVSAYDRDRLVGQSAPIDLAPQQRAEQVLTLTLPDAGEQRQVALLLQRDQRSEPYRSLWLWLTVKDRA